MFRHRNVDNEDNANDVSDKKTRTALLCSLVPGLNEDPTSAKPTNNRNCRILHMRS